MRRFLLNGPGYALLVRELCARRRAVMRITAWSVVESLPSLVSGLAVAAAIDRFLLGEVLAGFGFLALLPSTGAVGVFATRQILPWLASVVEPVRDAFLTAVVESTVMRAVGPAGRSDTAGVSRLTEQVQGVRDTLSALLRTIRQIVFSFVAAILGLAALAPAVAVMSGVLVVLALTLFALLLPRLAAGYRAVLLAEEDVARRAGAAFEGLRDAIACSADGRAIADVGSSVEREAALTRALARTNALSSLVPFIGGQLPLVALLAAAPWMLREGYLTLGEAVGAATYLTVGLGAAVHGIVAVIGGLGVDLVTTLGRLGEELAAVPGPGLSEQQLTREPASPGFQQRGVPAPDHFDLDIRGLSFAYGPHAAPVVRNLHVTVPEGGHLAVVGPSGTGKSTLASLIAGLLEPQRGVVMFGGVDVGEIREADLRRLVGLIPQEAYVFAGTLRENLLYLAPQATEGDLTHAASVLGLLPLVDRLGGFDALVGTGGAELSQGEKQLVALARVYLSPARLVLLDEATSNLDPKTEAGVEAAFARRAGSLIVIAHRISSARRAQRILLIDGDSVHQGTHDDLLRTSVLYANLVGLWDLSDAFPTPPANEAA